MKILFDNALERATLSSLYASPNYPAANLAHRILKKRWQAIVNSDTITLEWAAAETVSCIYVGYTNATAFTLRLYDAASVLLKTVAFMPSDMAVHFAAVAGVRSAELDIENALSSVYLGGIGIGEEYSMPDPRNDWTEPLLDNSVVDRSSDGQVFANPIAPRRSLPLSFFTVGFDTFKAIRDLIEPIHRSVPVYVDAFENWHASVLPVYGTLELSGTKKTDHKIDFVLTVEEAR